MAVAAASEDLLACTPRLGRAVAVSWIAAALPAFVWMRPILDASPLSRAAYRDRRLLVLAR